MQRSFAPAIAANRFGLGAGPGELGRVSGDPRGWLLEQLSGPAPVVQGSGLRSTESIIAETLELRREQRKAQQENENAPSAEMPAVVQQLVKATQLYRPLYVEEATARLKHAVASDRPFVERLTHFWTNHFAVSVDKLIVRGIAGAFEREAIRPNVLGNFTDLLLAVERHPAMLLYLDNHLSVGPGSRAANVARRAKNPREVGINENLAREILELHTLGVNGGYTQQDVTTFAEVLTGWSVGGNMGRGAGRNRGEPGKFIFREAIHEPGAKTILGKRYAEGDESQGEAVLRDLAARPATASFIATKLARHFVADDPPADVVERLSKAFLRSNGDLPTVYRALIEAKDSWQKPLSKFKTPNDYVISTYRALQLSTDGSRRWLASLELLGQRTYGPGSPAGWPDRSADWDGASALLKRVEWADALGQRLGSRHDASALAPEVLGATLGAETRTAIARAASGSQALTLMLTAPEFMRR